MKGPLTFTVTTRDSKTKARTGIIETKHGVLQTPCFTPVGTKATVKAVLPKDLVSIGVQVVLANTYHLFLQPNDEVIRDAGGIHAFMGWNGPIATDSGGFQVFSLGTAFGKNISKVAVEEVSEEGVDVFREETLTEHVKLARIDEEGVTFTSHLDGSLHRFTPERSIEIQHNIGADIIFAFDECTSPTAPYEYQKEALDRTHRWAKRSLHTHLHNTSASEKQALFGVVQGGRFEDLRKESAETIAEMAFDGFGIGGSFAKEDMSNAVRWVNNILPDEKPRHLLGIGEPMDILMGVENGCDMFDCVMPTRLARHGVLYTNHGPLRITREKYRKDFTLIDVEGLWDTQQVYTRAYLSHLFRAEEMLAGTLATIHNVAFMMNFMKNIRLAIKEGRFSEFKKEFIATYYGS